MKSIFKSVATITFFTLITRALGFFFRIFLSRAIGAEALGLYQVALSVFMVLLTIVSSGFTLIISRMTASYRVMSNKKAMSTLVTSAMIVVVSVSLILCAVILAFRSVFSNLFSDENCMNILIILLPSLVFSAVYSVFRGAMWGCDNYFGLCVSELLEQVVKIVICVLLLASGMSAIESAMSVAWSFTLSCFISAFFVMLLYFFYGGKMGKPSNVYRTLIRQSSSITGVRVASSFVQPLIALILPAALVATGYTNSQAMSLYGIAVGMTLPFLYIPCSIISSLSTALVPDISMAVVQNDNEHIQKRVSSSLIFAMFVSFLIAPIFLAIGDKFGVFIYGETLSGTLLQFAAWVMIPIGVTNITSAILNSLGLEVRSFINYIIGAVFLFACVIFLPKYLGINALIIGMGIESVVVALLNVWMIKRRLKCKLGITKKFLQTCLISIPCVALTSFVSSLLEYIFPLFFDLAISSGLGILTFLILCAVFNVFDFSAFFVNMSDRMKNLKKAKKTAKNAKI